MPRIYGVNKAVEVADFTQQFYVVGVLTTKTAIASGSSSVRNWFWVVGKSATKTGIALSTGYVRTSIFFSHFRFRILKKSVPAAIQIFLIFFSCSYIFYKILVLFVQNR